MKNFKRRGILFVLSSPSGAGKSSISKYILKTDKHIHLSVSFTTRKKRNEEIFGKDYNFISKSDFQKKVNEGYFLEWAEVFGNYYGTPKDAVQKSISNGIDVLFDIDWQGTQQLKNIKELSLITFFILPPNIKVLRNRLLNRHEGHVKLIEERMRKFNEEVSHWEEYNYIVVNDDLDKCYNKILDIINSEKKGIKVKQNLNQIKSIVGELTK